MYVEDKKYLIQKLNQIEEILDKSLLITLDVKYLHTNVPNNEQIKAGKDAYDKYPNRIVSTKLTLTFLSLILNLDSFYI